MPQRWVTGAALPLLVIVFSGLLAGCSKTQEVAPPSTQDYESRITAVQNSTQLSDKEKRRQVETLQAQSQSQP